MRIQQEGVQCYFKELFPTPANRQDVAVEHHRAERKENAGLQQHGFARLANANHFPDID